MKRIEHLLFKLAEECSEVAQRSSKAARFGLDEVQPGQPLNNRERIIAEYQDLVAALELLGLNRINREAVEASKRKFEHYLRYSAQHGTVSE